MHEINSNKNGMSSPVIFLGYVGLLLIASLSAIFTYLLIVKIDQSGKPLCETDQIIFGNWTECFEGYQSRAVTPATTCEMPKDILIKRSCESTNRKVNLFQRGICSPDNPRQPFYLK